MKYSKEVIAAKAKFVLEGFRTGDMRSHMLVNVMAFRTNLQNEQIYTMIQRLANEN